MLTLLRKGKKSFVHLVIYTMALSIQKIICLFVACFLRDSLAAQLEITHTKADSEQLARSIAEEQYSDLEKEKIMKELELKEMMARHRQELSEKDITISLVCDRCHLTCGKIKTFGSLCEL